MLCEIQFAVFKNGGKIMRWLMNAKKIYMLVSVLGEEMVLDGYSNVINIDNSAVCFEQLNARYKGKKEFTGLTCEFTDACPLHQKSWYIYKNDKSLSIHFFVLEKKIKNLWFSSSLLVHNTNTFLRGLGGYLVQFYNLLNIFWYYII